MSYFTGSDEDLQNILINIKNTRSYENITNINHVMYVYNEIKHINFDNIFDEEFGIHNNPIFIDINSKLKYHQRYFYKSSIYNEILARALGIKKGIDRPVVWDTTAGMMGDSLLIYAMGCKMIVSERNPLAAVLITNALKNSSLAKYFVSLF